MDRQRAAFTLCPIKRHWGRALVRQAALLIAVCCCAAPLLPLAQGKAAPNVRTSPAVIPANEPITPIPPPPASDPAKLALGERLFMDRRLSGDRTLACSSCHDIRTSGADDRAKSVSEAGSQLRFNTPTVFNAGLSFRLNWEGNFRSLESQAEASLRAPMGSSVELALSRLESDPGMVRQFRTAYGRAPDRASLLDAIAVYERSLRTPGSRFDRWLEGDRTALSADEQEGYRLFRDIGCSSCHQGMNVGGNLFERYGIFHPLASPEPGRLRVPSLRNVAMTPPYFHDGSAATLDEAVRKMAYAQLDRTLTRDQIRAIVAFLGTLTGKYRGVSVKARSP